MAHKIIGDTARTNICFTIGTLAGTLVVLPDLVRVDWAGLSQETVLAVFVPFYLVMWLVYVGLYLAWTHAVYSRRSARGLVALARREKAAQRSRWARWMGGSGASGTTLAAATVAIAITLAIAQSPDYRGEATYLVAGLLAVGSAWALMVFGFAREYIYLNVEPREDGTQHIEHPVAGPAEFGDYLTFTVMLSVMGATASAEIRSRRAWLLVRTNVLFAFVFNSVIVAMMVSMLFGGLSA